MEAETRAFGKIHGIDSGMNFSELKTVGRAALEWAYDGELGYSGPHFEIADLFSGCGGLSLGFQAVGRLTGRYHHIFAADSDKHANATYEKNLGQKPHNTPLSPDTVPDYVSRISEARSNGAELILVGGPPCQGFSSHRKKDPRSDDRNSLVGLYAEIATKLSPRMVVLENVPDLVTKKHWSDYEQFISVLEGHGYHVYATIAGMASFGVPQRRFRTIVIASKVDPVFMRAGPLPPSDYRTVRQAIGHLPVVAPWEEAKDDPMHITSKHRDSTIDVIKQVPLDGGSRPKGVGPACLDRVNGFSDVYGRLYWDKPSVTITARCRTPSTGRYVHPEQHRGLTIREAALLQGFPGDFIFEGPFDDKFKQIGNAVPPTFSTFVAAHVLALTDRAAPDGWGDVRPSISEPQHRSYSGAFQSLERRWKN